ncbi:hypothetical protein [Pseudomonas fluorescens]|uniref:hypothetical protein n=2 Tax=Pseudomonas TaxID=286 RepID=UPI000A1DB617|nr:hypothetical protein [Pseudomonas fluorescens]QTD34793.1 hypothetical protein JZM58_07995 [Pseudomonas fluorescens]
MWFCEGSRIDWTAIGAIATGVAALIALGVWGFDKLQRSGERGTSAKFLAQIMTTPVGAAQVEIASFRSAVVPPGNDQSYVLGMLNSQETRKDFASRATFLTFDLPSQYLDKADLFSEAINRRVAYALSQVNRLKTMANLLATLPDSAREEDINEHTLAALKQIQETETSIGDAFQVLLKASKSSA